MPLKAIETFSHQGLQAPDVLNHYNEDRVVAEGHTFAAIDGASAVIKAEKDGLNPSAYTAQWLQGFLAAEGHDTAVKETPAAATLAAANQAFADHLRRHWPEMAVAEKLGPSASVVVVRLHGQRYSYAALGDSVLLECRAGQWQQITTENHRELDAKMENRVADLCATQPLAEARLQPEIRQMIAAARDLSNVDYGIFNGETAAEKFIVAGERDLAGVEALLLVSDGMSWPAGATEAEEYIQAAQKMLATGAFAYHQELQRLYAEDEAGTRFPRFKHMDDATAVLLRMC